MIQSSPTEPVRLSWRFPTTFWIANISELFERAAFYGMFIALTVYLTDRVGFTDVEAGIVGAFFSCILYFLPVFLGAVADKIGFRPSLILAFFLLGVGYTVLGASQAKPIIIFSLTLIAFGGAIVKPVILGTAAKCSDAHHRARAFSIFYFMVNIGAFLGKSVAAPLRLSLGLEYINYYSASMAFCAMILVAIAYTSPDRTGVGRSLAQVWRDFVTVLRNVRFMCLILIVAGFWLIQGQLYASMPKYILRLVGEQAKPEWLANINPLVVVCCVMPITQLVRTMKPEYSIGISLVIIPLSALVPTLGPWLQSTSGPQVSFGLFSLHPVTVVVIVGIGLQGLAECFLSPKFMEYASRQAPPGQEGLYMGFQNLPTSISWFAGFFISGFLLDAYCPDPVKLKLIDPAQHELWQAAIAGQGTMPAAYAHAHYIWFVFSGIGAAAFVALLIFNAVTKRIDLRKGVSI